MPADEGQSLVTEFKIRVDGSDLPLEAAADLIAVTVQEDVDHPSAFSVTLNNWDTEKIDMKWSEQDLFKVGKQLEVQMGYLGKLEPLITGEITGLELVIHSARGPRLIVRGYDRGHRLTRGRCTMSYTNVTDSDIATQIAGNYGLSAEVKTTPVTYKYLLQHNQTDAEFLRARARRIGYEVFVREKKLFFRPRDTEAHQSAVISHGEGLIDFFPRLSTMYQTSKVEVRSWDLNEKEAWIGRASSSDESGKMEGEAIGLEIAQQAFGDATFATGTHPATSQADADLRAKGLLKEMALSYISGEGTSIGRTDLRAGSMVKVEGIGKRFSGLYYLKATTHTYAPGIGYRTSFQARRNAS